MSIWKFFCWLCCARVYIMRSFFSKCWTLKATNWVWCVCVWTQINKLLSFQQQQQKTSIDSIESIDQKNWCERKMMIIMIIMTRHHDRRKRRRKKMYLKIQLTTIHSSLIDLSFSSFTVFSLKKVDYSVFHSFIQF